MNRMESTVLGARLQSWPKWYFWMVGREMVVRWVGLPEVGMKTEVDLE